MVANGGDPSLLSNCSAALSRSIEELATATCAEGDGQEVAPTPKVMALAFDEAAGRFAGLTPDLILLASNPTESGDGIGAGNFQTGRAWNIQGDAPIGRVNR